MTYRALLDDLLREDEDSRGQPYDDATGKRIRAPQGNVTIGIGRNLDQKPLSPAAQAFLLDEDIRDAEADARVLVPNFEALSDVRKAVVVSMAFNLGRDRLAGFVNTLRAIREERWVDAAAGMRASKWATQLPNRSKKLANAMEADRL